MRHPKGVSGAADRSSSPTGNLFDHHTAAKTDCNPLSLVARYLSHSKPEYSDKTITNRRHILLPMFRAIRIDDIRKLTLVDISEWQAKRNDKPSTVSTNKQIIRDFLKWCAEYLELDLALNPYAITRRRAKPARPSIFTADDIDRVAHACTANQDRLMIHLMFRTGMRIGEVLDLRVDDIHGTQILIRGKGDKDRVVHMPRWLADEIMDYAAAGWVFKPLQAHNSHPDERYISAYTVRDRLQRIFWRVLGRSMRPHDLRHSFAVAWLRARGDLRTLQIMMGHASIETTAWYLQLADNEVGDIYAQVFDK